MYDLDTTQGKFEGSVRVRVTEVEIRKFAKFDDDDIVPMGIVSPRCSITDDWS